MNVHAVFFLSYVHIWLPIVFESSFLRVKTSNRFVVKNILEWKRERMLKECLTSECFETVNSYWTLEKDKKNSKHYKTHLNVIESHEKRVTRYIRMQIGGKKRGIKTRVCRPRENSWVTCVHKLRMWTSVVISPLKGPKHGESILEQSRSLYRVARPV